MLEGSNSVLLMNKNEPNKLYLAKNGSPLYIGMLEDGYIVGSETSTFSNFTQEFIDPEDNRVVCLDLTEQSPKFAVGRKVERTTKEKIH